MEQADHGTGKEKPGARPEWIGVTAIYGVGTLLIKLFADEPSIWMIWVLFLVFATGWLLIAWIARVDAEKQGRPVVSAQWQALQRKYGLSVAFVLLGGVQLAQAGGALSREGLSWSSGLGSAGGVLLLTGALVTLWPHARKH